MLQCPASLLLLLLAAFPASAQNEVGIYFDPAGTISEAVVYPTPQGPAFVELYVVLHEATIAVSGFDYHIGRVPVGFHPAVIGAEFPGICGPWHCDPMGTRVFRRYCECSEGSTIVLEILQVLVWPEQGDGTFTIKPLECLYSSPTGFEIVSCDDPGAFSGLPMQLAADAEARVIWGPVANDSPSFGAVKGLYDGR